MAEILFSFGVAKEAFIAALDDSRLQLKVMEREPKLLRKL